MIVHRMEQGTLEWYTQRLGLPSCSQNDRIISPKQLKPSASQTDYRAELMAEWLLGQPLDWGTTGWTERGTEMEDEARSWYEMMHDVEVDRVGFVTRDDGLYGGSPDGLVPALNRGLEIKCLGAKAHMKLLLGDDIRHIGQCQGYMYVTGLDEWDFLAYHPSLPKYLKTLHRDEKYLAAFVSALDAFIERLEEEKERWADYRVERPWHESVQAELRAQG